MGTVAGLIPIFFMMYVIVWLLSNSPCGKSELFIGVAILLLFLVLFLGYIGKKETINYV
jgi:high-affinity Fe2+/Pb2+ permease